MTMLNILKETLADIGCSDMGSLPDCEQSLIAECCYHRVPAKAIAEMIRAMRLAETHAAVPKLSLDSELLEIANKAETTGLLSRLFARRASKQK